MDFRVVVGGAFDFIGKKINKQTGFFHFHPNELQGEVAYTIPIYENVLYSLLLCATKTKEHVEEAQLLLDRIVAFQNKGSSSERGTFPRYITDYPRSSGIRDLLHILRALFILIKEYGIVLGKARVENIQEALFLLAEAVCERIFLKERSLVVYVELASILAAISAKFSKDYSATIEKCTAKGIEKLSLENVLEKGAFGDLLFSWHVYRDAFPEAFWEKLFSWAFLFWHPSFGDMTPSLEQKGYEPYPSMYTVYMGLLHGMPLRPSNALLTVGLFSGLGKEWPMYQEKEEKEWLVVKKEQFGFFVAPPTQENLFFFLEKNHSLILEKEALELYRVFWDKEKSTLELSFLVDGVKKESALHFYVNQQPLFSLDVEGKKATTYIEKDTVALHFDDLKVEMRQKVSSGDATFFGHIQRGNRTSQIMRPQDWSCFDVELFLRKVQGSQSTLDIEIRFQ